MQFDGFVSYSHAADGQLAPAIQSALHRLARPWYRRRALHVFRDQTNLSAAPELWSRIRLNVVAGATDAWRAMLLTSCRKVEPLTAIFGFL
jgi:hypothetical protein